MESKELPHHMVHFKQVRSAIDGRSNEYMFCFHTTWYILNKKISDNNAVEYSMLPHHMVHFKREDETYEELDLLGVPLLPHHMVHFKPRTSGRSSSSELKLPHHMVHFKQKNGKI